MLSVAAGGGWGVGIVLGAVAVVVAVAIIVTLLYLAFEIASLAGAAEHGVELIRQQTSELDGIPRANDSAVRILRATRALRKVAVGE